MLTGNFSGSVGLPSTKARSRIISEGLRTWLDASNKKSYPRFGNIWKDLSGYGNDATLVNNPRWLPIKKGAFRFDGINDYVALAANSIQSNSDLTIGMFFSYPNINSPLSFTLLSGLSSSGYLQMTIPSFSSRLRLLTSPNTNFLQTLEVFTTARNYGITFTINRLNNACSIFSNGALLVSGTAPTFTAFDSPVIGCNGSVGTNQFLGNIFNFYYYNRVLSPSEIVINHTIINKIIKV